MLDGRGVFGTKFRLVFSITLLPAANNASERAARPSVIHRKVTNGSRRQDRLPGLTNPPVQLRSVKLQLQAAIEMNPQRLRSRCTLQVRHENLASAATTP